MSEIAKNDRMFDDSDRSEISNHAFNFTENLPLVKVPVSLVLAPWLAKKAESGFGGDINDLEILAATLVIAEEDLYGRIPPPWCFKEKPIDYYFRFARDSRLAEQSIQVWQAIAMNANAFRGKQKLRPLSEILDGVEQLRMEILASPAEELYELATEVDQLTACGQPDDCLNYLLSAKLTTELTCLGERLNITPAAFLGVLLPIAASLLEIETQIEIDSATDFYPRPILWMGLVAESGSAKSPIFDTLIKPLERLQVEAEEIYQQKLESFEADLAEWEKTPKDERGCKPKLPMPCELYFQDATIEALAEALSYQPNRGVLQAVDELAGFFNGLNQYKPGGKGSDRQKWLSTYDGKGIKVNRKGDKHRTNNRLLVPRTAVSLVGTIQPSTLRRAMGNLDEVDGFWPRFYWVRLPLTKMPPPSGQRKLNLDDMLYELYQGLSSLEARTYSLNQEGHSLWRDWHVWTEDQKLGESRSALQAIYPKARERAARIALVVHCLNAVVEKREPEVTVSHQTLSLAIAFTEWTIRQTLRVYAEVGMVDHPETARIIRFIERFQGWEWIPKREVQRWYPKKPQITAEEAEVFMQKLIDLGYARSNGEVGRKFKIQLTANRPDNPDKSALSQAQTELDAPDNPADLNLTIPDISNPSTPAVPTVVSQSQENVRTVVSLPKSLQDESSEANVRNVSKRTVREPEVSIASTEKIFAIGMKVRKRQKKGWIGVIQAIQGDSADVLWTHDQVPTPVSLGDLETIS